MKVFILTLTLIASTKVFSQNNMNCSGLLDLTSGNTIAVNFSIPELEVGKSIYFPHPVIHDTENVVSAIIVELYNRNNKLIVVANSNLDELNLSFELFVDKLGHLVVLNFKGEEYGSAFGPIKLNCTMELIF